MKDDIMVDVIMPVYNHEKYLKQAIESVVKQKANFKYRLIIGEDCSKDTSRQIVQHYAALYPEVILPLYNEVNLGSTGNSSNILLSVNAKYIAICEGDDYWIDESKLQKQVDFLEANPDFSICFSDVEIVDEMNSGLLLFPILQKDVFTIEDFILSDMNIIPTPSLLFRNLLPSPMPAFFNRALGGDMITQLLLADKGKAKYINEKLAVYRNNAGGITKTKEHVGQHEIALKRSYMELDEYFEHRYTGIFKKRFLKMAKVDLIFGAKGKKGLERWRHYLQKMPNYLKYSEKINFRELAYYHVILFFPFLLKRK